MGMESPWPGSVLDELAEDVPRASPVATANARVDLTNTPWILGGLCGCESETVQ